jgi:hypothetical protein
LRRIQRAGLKIPGYHHRPMSLNPTRMHKNA